jgi:ribosomal protein S18 acetylase RimI-like enzyme
MSEVAIRGLREADLDAIERIYASHAASAPPAGWRDRISALLEGAQERTVAWIAEGSDAEVAGYIAGEVRSWEFGSEPVGWIFAIGVAPSFQRQGVAEKLLQAATDSLAELGVSTVRTMAKRDDVTVLRFFRSCGFRAGPYTELEIDLEER